jgi:tetratricopeptide (TPR) repeat protein
VGVHTGLVVVGEMGGGARYELLALGEAPHLAARLQGFADPDAVVISGATYRLVQGLFACQELGVHPLKGISQPIEVYRVLRESGLQSRFEVAMTTGLTPLVGRDQEVGLLRERWAQIKDGQGQVEEGVAQIGSGLGAWRTTGAEVLRPYYLALLAEAYGKSGQAEEGLDVLTEALALVAKTGERWWEAELYRLEGELLLQQAGGRDASQTGPAYIGSGTGTGASVVAEAERCFRQALDIARRQQAKSLELRAAMSLSRLWQQRGKRGKAYDLLAPIYGWFTEGFDTADLQEAKPLLQALS